MPLDSWMYFWILGSVFGFCDVFWILGKCFWILGCVLDFGKCFVRMSHRSSLITNTAIHSLSAVCREMCGRHLSFGFLKNFFTAGFDYAKPRLALSKHFPLDLHKRHDSFCFISFRETLCNVFWTSLQTADAFPVVASLSRSDDRKCVCCSQAGSEYKIMRNFIV